MIGCYRIKGKWGENVEKYGNIMLRTGMVLLIPIYVLFLNLILNDGEVRMLKNIALQIIFIVIILLLSSKDNEFGKIFKVQKIKIVSFGKYLLYGIVSFVVGMGLMTMIFSLLKGNVYIYDESVPKDCFILFLIEVVVLVPILEELLYRHILCRDIKALTGDGFSAIVISALVFSLFKGSKEMFIVTLPLGIVTGFLQNETDNPHCSMIAHMGFAVAYVFYLVY